MASITVKNISRLIELENKLLSDKDDLGSYFNNYLTQASYLTNYIKGDLAKRIAGAEVEIKTVTAHLQETLQILVKLIEKISTESAEQDKNQYRAITGKLDDLMALGIGALAGNNSGAGVNGDMTAGGDLAGRDMYKYSGTGSVSGGGGGFAPSASSKSPLPNKEQPSGTGKSNPGACVPSGCAKKTTPCTPSMEKPTGNIEQKAKQSADGNIGIKNGTTAGGSSLSKGNQVSNYRGGGGPGVSIGYPSFGGSGGSATPNNKKASGETAGGKFTGMSNDGELGIIQDSGDVVGTIVGDVNKNTNQDASFNTNSNVSKNMGNVQNSAASFGSEAIQPNTNISQTNNLDKVGKAGLAIGLGTVGLGAAFKNKDSKDDGEITFDENELAPEGGIW